MKSAARRSQSAPSDSATLEILRALRRARKTAVRTAKLHKVPLVYLSRGKIVRQFP